MDIKIGRDGDIELSVSGDIQLTESIQQDILIHLRWIFAEWRLGPEFGLPYFEDILVKAPRVEAIKRDIINEIMKCNKVVDAEITLFDFNQAERTLRVRYKAYTDEESFMDEVKLYG